MSKQPWASGPSEILQHGLSLLNKDSDSNRRLAMLSIDNAVELTVKTFLSLPRRVTGINLSRKEYQDISESFPQLLDALEKHAKDKLEGINLGEIEWFHRLRNELYHQGNGLTVDKDKVEIYAELAKLLFRNLFGFDVSIKENNVPDLLGNFLAAWVDIEQILFELVANEVDTTQGVPPSIQAIDILQHLEIISSETAEQLDKLRKMRNRLIHGQEEHRKVLNSKIIDEVNLLAKELAELKKTMF